MSEEQEYQGSMEQFEHGPDINKPIESEQTKTILENSNDHSDVNLAPQQQALQNQIIQDEVQPNFQMEYKQASKLQQLSNAQQAEFQDMQQQQQLQPQQQYQQQQQPKQQQQQRQQQPQQKQQQQQNKVVQKPNSSGLGFFDKIKNYVGDIFSSESPYQYVPTNTYNDDDDLIHDIGQQKESSYNLEENIDFQVKAQYKMGTLRKDTSQLLPATISFCSKDIQIQENAKELPSIGIDLICVIDVSGSMSGTKINNVKKTLLILLDFLRDKDRLCLITFESSGQRMTPLKVVNEQNKKYFKSAINTLNARGGTQIGAGTSLAFKQMKERNSKNKVTSIFLLSDGQDSQAVKTVTQQIANVQEVFSINTFGFGDDHDAKMMSALSEVGKGSFYFIKDVTLLDEFFADALGGLVSAIGENLEIQVKCAPKKPFDNISIERTFGDMWTQIDKNRYYTITLPQIAAGAKKDYVFEIILPKFEGQIQDQERQVVVVDAICTLQGTGSAQKVTKHAQLELTLFNENEPIPANEQDLDVAAQHLRVKATDAIDDARRACEQNKNQDAEQMLQQMKVQIEQGDEKLKVAAKETLIDLEQASKACQKQNFGKHGSKQMAQMKVNNYNQRGINAQFDDLGEQMQQVEQAQFSNCVQTTFLKSVQKRKQ